MNTQSSNISINTSLSFKAKFVDTATIKKLHNYKYKNEPVNILALEKNDLAQLKQIAKDWKTEYSQYIYNNAKEELRPVNLNYDIYVLTNQTENFKTLNPDRVYGICEFNRCINHNNLTLLDVKPEYCYNKRDFKSILSLFSKNKRKIKHIGRGLIDFLKKETKNKPLEVYSSGDSIEFYKKNGFVEMTNDSNQLLIWKKKS